MQAAVDRMLTAPPPNASAEAQQQHLKLLVEVYKRTQNLAEQLQVQYLYLLKPERASNLSMHQCTWRQRLEWATARQGIWAFSADQQLRYRLSAGVSHSSS